MTLHTERGPQREARISLPQLVSNIAVFGGDAFTLDLSADAFGHGAQRIAVAAAESGVTSFSVRSASEAAYLRNRMPAGTHLTVKSVDETSVTHAYGLEPAKHRGTKPVMRLSGRVLAVKKIEAGAGVSYGYTWRAPDDGWLALVPLGYGDGFVRAWGNRATAQWQGISCPLAGRVAMDAHSIYTGAETAAVGDEVVYFGEHTSDVSAATFAEAVGAPVVSVTAALGLRIPRVYLDGVDAS
jgi:alanine racemase